MTARDPAMCALPERPVTILIAALGGEGGGVLADWLVDAAGAAGFPVQSTSIPGVSQRTGATTYYVEIYPARFELLGGRTPVLALTPSPGNLDVVAASELVEAGRAMQNGYVSPERTTLVASTHRIYATDEKLRPGDGRYDAQAVLQAAPRMARRAVLADMSVLAQTSGSVINAVLFGALCGSGALPLDREACEAAIRRAGKGGEASLRGFAAGYDVATGKFPAPAARPAPAAPAAPAGIDAFPQPLRETLALAVPRLVDFQDKAYAQEYLSRIRRLADAETDPQRPVSREAARQLAVWMSYEDVIRVADLKTRASRFERVRREVGARAGEPVRVVDYFKPGPAEWADLLPPSAAGWLRRRAHGRAPDPAGGVQLATSTVAGFLLLRSVALLKPWRRRTARYREEQALIERWLGALHEKLSQPALALEVARLPRLLKGYSDTQARGRASFEKLLEQALGGADASAIRRQREAALGDDAAKPAPGAPAGTAQKLVFMPRPKADAPQSPKARSL